MERPTTKTLSKGIRLVAKDRYVIQVWRNRHRLTKRVSGSPRDAERAREELLARLHSDLLHPPSPIATPASGGSTNVPTWSEWVEGRCRERSQAIHSENTRKVQRGHLKVLAFFFGDMRLDEINATEIHRFVEFLRKEPPLTFKVRKDGKLAAPRVAELRNITINQFLRTLRTWLRFAEAEGVIIKAPRVELLPEDDSDPITPPDSATLNRILAEAAKYVDEAPLLREAIELSIETGVRKAELFNLTWRSVKWDLGPERQGALEIAEQRRGRIVHGKAWKPKNRKTRVIPLSPRAREVLVRLRGATIPHPDTLVIPNDDGAPYERLGSATKGAGTSVWRRIKTALGHTVRWHDLRHLFAVRNLQGNVTIQVVSAWLGHSDVNLTCKRYGRFGAENHAQWQMMASASERPIAVEG